MPEERPFPSKQEIEPISNDPVLGVIKLTEQLGTRIKQIPHPASNLVGDTITTLANQHEGIHLTTINFLRLKNFVDAGGIEATQQELQALQEDPLRLLDMIQKDLQKTQEEFFQNFEE